MQCLNITGYKLVNGICNAVRIPWNEAGFQKSFLYSNISESELQSVSEVYSVDRTNLYPSICPDIVDGQSTDQDVPLTATTCFAQSKLQYDFYLVYSNAESQYVYAFLERQFGYNNRYIMWKIYKSGELQGRMQSRWRLPG